MESLNDVDVPTVEEAMDALSSLSAMVVEMGAQGLVGSAQMMADLLGTLDEFVRARCA